MEELKSLNDLYPDLGTELENRHSAHYSNLRRRFSKIYEDLEPHYFVSVKGTATLLEVAGTPLAVSMALENGVILAVATTYPNTDVYFNSPECDEEIVLSCKGQVKFGGSQLRTAISEAYELALSNYPVTKLMGGIVYFDANIRKEAPGYLNALRLGVAMTALLINNFRGESFEELEERILGKSRLGASLTSYNNYALLCGRHDAAGNSSELSASQMDLGVNTLLFYDLSLTPEETAYMSRRRELMNKELWEVERVASELIKQQTAALEIEEESSQSTPSTISSESCYLVHLLRGGHLTELMAHLPKEPEPLLDTLAGMKIQEESAQPPLTMNLPRRLQTLTEQYNLAASLSAGCNTEIVQHALRSNTELALRYDLYPPRIRSLLALCEEYEVHAATFTTSSHLVVLCRNKKMLALFDRLRKHMMESVDYSPDYEQKNLTSSLVKRKLFSSLPSRGCGVLNPKDEMWFM